MEWLIAAVVAVGAIVAFRILTRRALTIAELAIEDGAVRLVRGGIPASVLNDLRDIVRNPPVRTAKIRILRAARQAQVVTHGEISAGQIQRIRNVIGNVPLTRLATARRS